MSSSSGPEALSGEAGHRLGASDRALPPADPRPPRAPTARRKSQARFRSRSPWICDRVAGTITSLAAIELEEEYDRRRIHGHRLTLEAIGREVDRLARMPLAERAQVAGLHPDRAPVIVAGGIIVRETLAQLGLDGLTVSERDILHGIALEAALLPEPLKATTAKGLPFVSYGLPPEGRNFGMSAERAPRQQLIRRKRGS